MPTPTRARLSAMGLAALLAACGGDQFTGEPDAASDSSAAKDVSPPPDAAADSADGGQAEASCPVTAVLAVIEADSQIVQGQPTASWGSAAGMGARNDILTEALMRFDIAAVPLNATIQGVQLELAWASHWNDCSTSCGSCAGVDKAGTIDLYYMRSDWTESMVSWNMRDGSLVWGGAGAALSGTDRSASTVATTTRSTGQGASFTLDANGLKNLSSWRKNDKLSFLLQAEGNATFLAATREGKGLCTQTGGAPKLTISYCL